MVSEIYCYGGIDIYRDVLNAIALVKGDHSFMKSLITLGVIVGAFWSMVIMVGGDMIRPFLSWMIPMTVMQMVFLSPTKTVHLIDVVHVGRHETVAHVPYGLALLAGTLSRLSHHLTQKTETFFTIPNDLKYSTTGGIFAANLLANQKIMTIQDEDFAENMRSFIGNCVLYDLALGRKYTIKDLRHTENIWGLISANASPARSFVWRENRNRGTITTCQLGVTRFNHAWNTMLNQTACAAGAQLYPNRDRVTAGLPNGGGGSAATTPSHPCRSPLAKQAFLRFLPIHYGTLAAFGGHAGETLRQHMMIAALVDGQDHASVMAGNASNFAARKAYLQQRSHYETIGKLASDTLPTMRAVLELTCYALFLFMMPLLVLPQGYKVLVSWAKTILWLAMWPPLYAILHLIMVSAISIKTKAFIGISNPQGITLASSLGVQEISADMAAMAGYLSISIPFICIAMVKGLSSFVHMSGSISAISQGAATSAATEALTGNYQMGNTSMDNHSVGNVTMLSENYSGNLSSGNMRVQDGHVSITSSAHGGMVASVEQSNLPVSVNMAQSIASNQRMAAQQEMSVGMSQQQSAERSLGSSMEQLGTLGETLSNSTNVQKGWTEQQQQDAGHAMQMTHQAVDKLAQDTGITKGQAASILASVGAPDLARMLTGFSGGSNLESSSARQETIAKAKDISKQFQFDEHARIAMQATEHLSKISSDDTIQSFARNYQASVSEAAHENQSAQKHFEDAKRLTKEADFTESNSASINRNYNEKLIDYIADQEAPNVGGVLGKREAASIIARNDEVTKTYLDHFMREHAPQQSFAVSEASMRQAYEETDIPSVVDKGSVDTFTQQSKKNISQEVSLEAHGMEGRIKDTMRETNDVMVEAKAGVIDVERENLQKAYDRQSTDVGIAAALKGGFAAINNAVDSPQRFVEETMDDAKDVYHTLVDGDTKTMNSNDISERMTAAFDRKSLINGFKDKDIQEMSFKQEKGLERKDRFFDHERKNVGIGEVKQHVLDKREDTQASITKENKGEAIPFEEVFHQKRYNQPTAFPEETKVPNEKRAKIMIEGSDYASHLATEGASEIHSSDMGNDDQAFAQREGKTTDSNNEGLNMSSDRKIFVNDVHERGMAETSVKRGRLLEKSDRFTAQLHETIETGGMTDYARNKKGDTNASSITRYDEGGTVAFEGFGHQKEHNHDTNAMEEKAVVKKDMVGIAALGDRFSGSVNEIRDDIGAVDRNVAYDEKMATESGDFTRKDMLPENNMLGEDSDKSFNHEIPIVYAQSFDHNEKFVSRHDGSIESLFKEGGQQQEIKTVKVIKGKERPIRHENELLEKTNSPKDPLLGKDS